MRRVDLEKLPMKDYGDKKVIDWTGSKGVELPFIYDGIKGVIFIEGYNATKKELTVKYKGVTKTIRTSSLRNSQIARVVGKVNLKHKFAVNGTVITNSGKIKILKCIRIRGEKGYEYKCEVDGNLGRIAETDLVKGGGCSVCSNVKIVKGVNDVNTTHPEIAKYLTSKIDGDTHSYGSKKSLSMRCPECFAQREGSLNDVLANGFSCPLCGDGFSYPNKFMLNVLVQLGIDTVETEKEFAWSNRRRYDFYLPDKSLIIEVHGLQHYKGGFGRARGRSLKEERINDDKKLELARNNGVKNYIVVDCRHSDMEYIKNSIISSELSSVYNFDFVDWKECHKNSLKTLVKTVCNYRKEGLTRGVIAKKTNLSVSTVARYIKKGKGLGWCS